MVIVGAREEAERFRVHLAAEAAVGPITGLRDSHWGETSPRLIV